MGPRKDTALGAGDKIRNKTWLLWELRLGLHGRKPETGCLRRMTAGRPEEPAGVGGAKRWEARK